MVAGKSKQEESPSTESQFSHAATKVAVAQICRSTGFKRCNPSALNALTLISSFYLQSLARSAASCAAVAGRTQANLLDVVCALEELASPIGFPGGSRPCRSLLSSSTLRGLRSFVRTKEELPFAKPIPDRRGDHESTPVIANMRPGDDRRRRLEIPPWLPEFPDVSDGAEDQVRSELHWEDMRVGKREMGKKQGLLKLVDKRKKMLPLNRNRVKFRLVGKEKGKMNLKVLFLET